MNLLRSPARRLATAHLAGSVGDGAFYVCSALYFARVVGLSPAQIGAGLTLAWGVGAVAGIPLGHLADRRGSRGVSVLLALATAAAVGSFLVVRSFVPFVLAACLYASFQSGLGAARQALLAGLVAPERRTAVRARLQSVTNAGIAVGAAIGGLALSADTEGAYLTVFALDAAGFVAAALLLTRLPAVPPAPVPAEGERGRALAVLRDRPYALVTLLNMIMLLYMPLLSLVLPLWIVQRTDAPRWLVSALLVANTVGVVLFQVRVARGVRDLRSAARSVRRAGAVMLPACAVFALSAAADSPWLAALVLLTGAALQVVAEMMLGAGSWEIGFALAPPHRQGQYQGFYGMGVPVARMVGPALLTTLVVGWGVPGWLLLGAVFLAAGCAMGPAVRRAEQRTERRAATPAPPPMLLSGR
ncbi:MFS transporter [Actinomadura macrotermitis]|uniref:MFS transporter n=1 Tax=Actinomadura macrotermitis TaxID=2585200 RepID=A0A7K0C7H6_9ACTN|nr:hypothetical protein [Actinomadura macrotermitis]